MFKRNLFSIATLALLFGLGVAERQFDVHEGHPFHGKALKKSMVTDERGHHHVRLNRKTMDNFTLRNIERVQEVEMINGPSLKDRIMNAIYGEVDEV